MKKIECRLVFLILLLFIFQGTSNAEKFGIKLTGGLNYLLVGDLNKGVRGSMDLWKDYHSYIPECSMGGEAKPIHLGFEIEGDIIFDLTQKLGIGLGAGYIYGASTSKIALSCLGGYENSWDNKAKISASPIRVGIFYTVFANKKMKVVYNTGIGLYLAKYSYIETSPMTGGGTKDQKASAEGFGLHGGMGIEFNLTPTIGLVIEAQGRYAKVGSFEGKIKYLGIIPQPWEEEGLLYYWEKTFTSHEAKNAHITKKYPQVYIREKKPSGLGINSVREATIDFSGFTLMGGIKFNF